ncbi:hypothetical protein E1B28_000294 [Marasmius oreades]|uniref:Uncharacterized protein n=1 Tax=Marasmius oreades TaxID=181124 RepID=A0A9P7V108_9AGAR|nr:uncharacterized protein E1B28_000294 [Marasmius oreades]KAG7098333.1 hypothetical protein E1B28_000294 [Marasmius oreades]
MDKGMNSALALLNLLKLEPATAKTLAVLVVVVPLTYIALRIRYPCVTSTSLLKTVQLAKETFDKCVLTESFNEGEYDGYKKRLHR